MLKKKKPFRDSLFFLIGVFIYSLLFWVTRNHAQVLGIFLIALGGLIFSRMDKKVSEKEWLKTNDVIYMSIGAVFDSLSNGFPFGYF